MGEERGGKGGKGRDGKERKGKKNKRKERKWKERKETKGKEWIMSFGDSNFVNLWLIRVCRKLFLVTNLGNKL